MFRKASIDLADSKNGFSHTSEMIMTNSKKEVNTTSSDQSDNGLDSQNGSMTNKDLAESLNRFKSGDVLASSLSQVLSFIDCEESKEAKRYFSERDHLNNSSSNREVYSKFKADRSVRDFHYTVHQFISQ